MFSEQRLLDVSSQFLIPGTIQHAELCKIGHINETYTATYEHDGRQARYVHQKINTDVFKDPDAVMSNVSRVTEHLHRKLAASSTPDADRRALRVIPTRDGQSFYKNPAGESWRTFQFIENALSYESVQTPAQAYQAGRAFGEFQAHLADLPGGRLVDTIPDFHHTVKRFETLEKTIAADRAGRVAGARAEVAFALAQRDWIGTIVNGLADGTIPERATHNDTKFNNVLLDVNTGEAVCVVDLDTMMPGSALYDFGDMVRTTTSPALEDELDLSKVEMRMPIFKELARGYIEAAGSFLTPAELALIAFSGRLITYTIGVRFLTDHLAGDTYFRVHRAGHNLDRARTQFALVRSIQSQEAEMQAWVNELAAARK